MADIGPEVVGGVDTHKDTHVAAVIDAVGRLLATAVFATTRQGYIDLVAWMRTFGHLTRIGVEGTGSYGAGLARHLAKNNIETIEVNRPNRQMRRNRGKSDTVDAEAAARAALNGQASAAPKTRDGLVESIRVLRIAFRSARDTRAVLGVQIRDLIVCAPDDLRGVLEPLSTAQRVELAARYRPGPIANPTEATRATLRCLARRYQSLTVEVEQLRTSLDTLTLEANPALRIAKGVGADVASILLIAVGDNPQRLRSEAAFAALCGVSPIEASSGKTVRHRLNQGGNRQANHALWRIALVRLSSDPATKAYAKRRRAEGKSTKEIIRCLKRYIAREIYRLLLNPTPVETSNTTDLRPARTAAHISLETVANALNTWPARISELERGIRPNPELEHNYRAWLKTQIAA